MGRDQKTVYLHLGQHKTGTTSIQNFLWGNRAELLKAGYDIPDTGVEGGAHHALCYALLGLKGRTDAEALITALDQEIRQSDCPNIILSSEEFERLGLPMVSLLIRKLSAHTLRPILYLRRQDGYLLSDYGQQIKMGAALPPINAYLDRPSFPERFNFLGLLANWIPADILTNGAVVVYDTLAPISVVHSFKKKIGLPMEFGEASGAPKFNRKSSK